LISRHRKKFLGFPVLLFLIAGFQADFIFMTTANDDGDDQIIGKNLSFRRHAAQMTSKNLSPAKILTYKTAQIKNMSVEF